jgi:hypothetical protein
MNRICFAALCVALALAANAPSAGAQGKKKPVSKPPVKSAANPPVKGTPQLPGDNGKIDQPYTMGIEQQLNYTLRSAEYTLGRLIVGTTAYVPTKEQKLLLLKFTIQNPNKADTQFRFDTFKYMAVDSKDVNHEGVGDVAKQDENKEALDINLKPGQKVNVVSGILIPADASVPKLMVIHHSGGKVLRYDLRELIKPLPTPFADPTDKTGAKARGDVPGEKDVFYPLALLDLKYVSSALTTEKLGDYASGDGKQFLVVTVTLRNGTNSKQNYRFDTLGVRLIAADGEKEDRQNVPLLKTSRNEDADGALETGESYTCRLLVEVAKDSNLAKLALRQGESHAYVFDVSNVK